MLEDDGWTILHDIKNNSNNGIDIVAQGSKGELGFFEVKSSSNGKFPNISSDTTTSKGQKNPEVFIKERLSRAANGKYNNLAAEETAKHLYNDLFDPGDDIYYNVTASTITVDFSTDTISIARW